MSLVVSAIQLTFEYAATPQAFFDQVREPIERAAREGAQLIVLPNYIGWQLLGIPVSAARGERTLDAIARASKFESVSTMLREVAPATRNFFTYLFASLAQRLKVYLAPGTLLEREGARLYNTAYLFAPDGSIKLAQRQTHRAPNEIAWGLTQGDALTVYEMGSARVGFVIGTDVEYPEVARILALQGANVLIHPAAYPVWRKQHYLVDLWRDVQSNQTFGVQACLLGGEWKGQSAIYAPVDGTADRRGMLAQASRAADAKIISAPLDFAMLEQAATQFPIFDFFNYDFYAREFPSAYLK